MKYAPTAKDLERIKSFDDRHPVNLYLRHRENNKFKAGDILIKMKRHGYGSNIKWVTETISSTTKLPVKYIFIYENEHGVGYVKRIKANGSSVCDEVICLADLDYNRMYFTVDPDFIDHIMLSGEADIDHGAEFKAKRKEQNRVNNLNRKFVQKFANEQESGDFLSKMQPGQDFWFGWSLREASQQCYTVLSVSLEQDPYKRNKLPSIEVKYAKKGETKPYSTLYSDNLHKGGCLFLKQPYVAKI